MRIKHALLVALLAACAGCNKAAPDTSAQDQSDIQALEDHWVAAVKAKDVTAIMSVYVPDESLIVFDLVPPLQYSGAAAYRKDWQDTFAVYLGWPTPASAIWRSRRAATSLTVTAFSTSP